MFTSHPTKKSSPQKSKKNLALPPHRSHFHSVFHLLKLKGVVFTFFSPQASMSTKMILIEAPVMQIT